MTQNSPDNSTSSTDVTNQPPTNQNQFNPSPKATYTVHDVKVGNADLNVTCVMDQDGVTFIPTHTIRAQESQDYDNRLFFPTKEAQRMAMAILTQGSVADTREDIKSILLTALRDATDLCDELAEFISSMAEIR